MHINAPRDGDIRYNPINGSFEARITIRDADGLFIYPVQVAAPLMAEIRMIKAAMVETARKMHAAPSKGLHLRQLAPTTARLAA